jgi:hypothetical protein
MDDFVGWIDSWTDTDGIIITQSSLSSGFNAKVIDLEDFNADILIHSTERAIFLMATYGEGINHTIPYHYYHDVYIISFIDDNHHLYIISISSAS